MWKHTILRNVSTHQERRQYFLQSWQIFLYAKWADFLKINAGQDGNIGVIQLQSLIDVENKYMGSVEELAFFTDFIAVFNK